MTEKKTEKRTEKRKSGEFGVFDRKSPPFAEIAKDRAPSSLFVGRPNGKSKSTGRSACATTLGFGNELRSKSTD
jgi:hypothetical protein